VACTDVTCTVSHFICEHVQECPIDGRLICIHNGLTNWRVVQVIAGRTY
jgi:hypothetical protein